MEAFIVFGLYILISFASLCLAVLTIRSSSPDFRKPLAYAMALTALEPLFVIMEDISPSIIEKTFWQSCEYTVLSALAIALILFIFSYAGRSDLINRRNLLLLSIVPFFCIILDFLDPWTHLFNTGAKTIVYQNMVLALWTYGPAYWSLILFYAVLFLIGSDLVIKMLLRSPQWQRDQIATVTLAFITLVIGTVLNTIVATGDPLLNLTLISIMFSYAFLFIAIIKMGFLNIMPIVLKGMVEGMDSGVVIIDPANRLAYINRVARDIFGLENTEGLGKDASFIISKIDQSYQGVIGQSLVIENTGGRRYFEVSKKEIFEQGRTNGTIILLHDISELRRVEDVLRTANMKMNLLTSVTRHDIQNQLLVVRGMARLISLDNPEPNIVTRTNKIDRAVGSIEKSLKFTKEYEEIGINAPVWQNVEKIVRSSAPALAVENVKLRTNLNGLELFADPMVSKVFTNLAENTIMHGTNVTEVYVSFEVKGSICSIHYADDGVGISEHEKEAIFRKGYGKNTGLGLFLASEILSITDISMKEVGIPGKGVDFVIEVPKYNWRLSDPSEVFPSARSTQQIST